MNNNAKKIEGKIIGIVTKDYQIKKMIKQWIHMNHKVLYILYTNWTFKSISVLVNKNVVILKI
jgi:TusA-related sulfurtransferase